MLLPLPESRKYRLAKGWRIFMYVVAPLLMALFVGMPLLWWLEKPMPLLTVLYCLLPLSFALLLLYGLAEAIWGYVATGPEGITEVSVLGRRRLAWVEIKGYRMGSNYLRLLPTDMRKRPVRIGLLTKDIEALSDWITSYYPNLNPVATTVAEASPVPFAAPTARPASEQKLTEARQTARLLNRASWVVLVWLLCWPAPYTLAVAAGLLLPLGAMAAQWLYPNQLRADEPDASGIPSLGIALIMPTVGLFGRMLLDAELVRVAAVQPWAYPVSSGVALLLVAGSWQQLAGKNRDLGQLLIMLPAALLYGFSAPVAYNVAFDTSQPAYYEPQLLRKYINSDEFAGCTAVVAPWGPFRDSVLVHVSRARYNRLRPGSPVRVRLMPGALGMAWFRAVE